MRASLPSNLPWIRSVMIVGGDGRIQCSTTNMYVGVDLSDRAYLIKARETRNFVFSDFLLARPTNTPLIMAAYPVAAINADADAVILAAIDLDWLSKMMTNLGGRTGVSSVLVDSTGTVLAAPADQASRIGKPLDSVPLLSAIAHKALVSGADSGSIAFAAADGSNRLVNFRAIPGTQSRLIVSIDEARVTAAINRDIRTAYLQLGFVCLFVLLGALVGAEKLIIQPIEMMTGMARRFGDGEVRPAWRAAASFRIRAAGARLQRDGGAAQPARARTDHDQRPADGDGLDRHALRPCQSPRLPEPARFRVDEGAAISQRAVPPDDRCRSLQALQRHLWPSRRRRLPDQTWRDAVGHRRGHVGFAGRYGGEEFCLLLPNTDAARALEIGEVVRAAVQNLEIPHATSSHLTVTVSVGVACTLPSDTHSPGDLIEAADAALYAAKHRGRNTVVEHGFVRLVDKAGMALAG